MSDPTLEFTKDRECVPALHRLPEPSSPGRTSPRCLHTQPWPFLMKRRVVYNTLDRAGAAQNHRLKLGSHMWNNEPTVRPSWSLQQRGQELISQEVPTGFYPQTGNCFHKPHLIHVGEACVSNYSRSPDVQHLGLCSDINFSSSSNLWQTMNSRREEVRPFGKQWL